MKKLKKVPKSAKAGRAGCKKTINTRHLSKKENSLVEIHKQENRLESNASTEEQSGSEEREQGS